MSELKAECLIAVAIIVRSMSYLFSSNLIHVLGPFNILSIRFSLAFIIMAVIFRKKVMAVSRQTLKHGGVLGLVLTLTMACELTGFRLTDAGITSFLEQVAIVLVPILHGLIIHKLPSREVLVCGLVCLTGIGFLTLNNGLAGLNWGCLFALLAAFLYAIFIIFTGRFAQDDDPMTLGIVQLIFVGIFGTVFSLLFETYTWPATGVQVGSLVMLAVACSCFGFTAQSVGQKYVDVGTVGLLCAISSLVVAIEGVLFLGESLKLNKIIGGALILVGICTLIYRQNKIQKTL